VNCRKDSAELRRQAYILLLADEGNRDGGFKDGDIAGFWHCDSRAYAQAMCHGRSGCALEPKGAGQPEEAHS